MSMKSKVTYHFFLEAINGDFWMETSPNSINQTVFEATLPSKERILSSHNIGFNFKIREVGVCTFDF